MPNGSVPLELVPRGLEPIGTVRNRYPQTEANTGLNRFRDVGTDLRSGTNGSAGSRSLERNQEPVLEPVKRTRRKCTPDCTCKRHRGHTPETRAKISATLKQRSETDPAWREHLVSISRKRHRRDKIAA